MIDKYCTFIKMEMMGATILVFALSMTGCAKRLEAPEVLDPIYNELLKEQKKIEKEIADGSKMLMEKQQELKTTQARTIERVRVLRDIGNLQKKIDHLSQLKRYFELRAEKRKYLSRETYKIAFQSGEPWPNPEDLKRYQSFKRLKEASRNWDSNVPKLTDRYAKKEELPKK